VVPGLTSTHRKWPVCRAAARHLQTKAAERQLPGPETVTKRNGLLKLLPRLYVREGGELAKYRVVLRQCALSGRFQPWDNRHEQPCPHCHSPYEFGDPCHLLLCGGAPPAFAAARSTALGRVAAPEAREGPVKLLCNLLVGESTQVPALRSVSPTRGSPPWVLGAVRTLAVGLSTRECLVLVKKAFKLAKLASDSLRAHRGPAVRTRVLRVCVLLALLQPALCCSLQFTLLLAPNTGRRCTQGGTVTRPDFHSS
jgi:hypothetical protein